MYSLLPQMLQWFIMVAQTPNNDTKNIIINSKYFTLVVRYNLYVYKIVQISMSNDLGEQTFNDVYECNSNGWMLLCMWNMLIN
jgi:hypothetical protein